MNEGYAQLVSGQRASRDTQADPLKTANDTSEIASTSKKLLAVIPKSSRGTAPSPDSFEEMDDQPVSKKGSKGAKKAKKASKPRTDSKDPLPAISKSVSRRRVEEQLDEAGLGDKIEAIISPKTERAEMPEISLKLAQQKPKSQLQLAPLALESLDKQPKKHEMQKSASLNKQPAPAFAASPERGPASVPKPLMSVLGRIKAGSPLQHIKSVFKKRRRLP